MSNKIRPTIDDNFTQMYFENIVSPAKLKIRILLHLHEEIK